MDGARADKSIKGRTGVHREFYFDFLVARIQKKTGRKRWILMGRLSREAIIFTTFCVDLGIAYKEIAESLCSRHNVVTVKGRRIYMGREACQINKYIPGLHPA